MIYLERPSGFISLFSAVGVFVESEGCILQLLRSDKKKSEPGKWGAPAGKIELNETAKAAAQRELCEEAGIAVMPDQLEFLKKVFVDYGHTCFEYSLFRLVFQFKPIVVLSSEHVAHVWIPPKYAQSLDLMKDEWECIQLVYACNKETKNEKQ